MKKKRHFLAIVMCACIIMTCKSTALALNLDLLTYGHRMTGGISNVYIYIDDKGSPRATYWQNLIKTAVNNWMYTGVGANDFYCLGYVSSGTSGSKIDFYARNSNWWLNNTNVLGATYYYDYNIRSVNQRSSDWYSARIDFNDTRLREDVYSNDDAIFVFIHEMGHAFGLNHNPDKNSIMYEALWPCNVRRVQKVDNDVLNCIY
ncbi:MAG: matrixin family metalloprotease [Muribaculaceae bacterium]|nr:matrixin family metalloprotease [Muribaculaceae bacterium]